MKIWDVAIHLNHGLFGGPGQPPEGWILKEEKVQLAGDVWVGKLDADRANEIIDGCEPPGKLTATPPRPTQLYTFVREVSLVVGQPSYWDYEQKLQTCIMFSRLVHPTTISLGYTAR